MWWTPWLWIFRIAYLGPAGTFSEEAVVGRLNADLAKTCIVLKRSMKPGFAGIENELFYNPKTSMLFGDAKSSLGKLVAELKTLG